MFTVSNQETSQSGSSTRCELKFKFKCSLILCYMKTLFNKKRALNALGKLG